MKHIEKIYDILTGEETFVERDYTIEEIKAIEEVRKIAELERAEVEVKTAARQAILDRLGLTEEEARLLLG